MISKVPNAMRNSIHNDVSSNELHESIVDDRSVGFIIFAVTRRGILLVPSP